jgi:MRG-binding protein
MYATVLQALTHSRQEDNYGEAIPDANDPASEPFVPFKLPRDEYGGMMHERRLAPEGSFSPPTLEHQLSTESHEGFTRRSTIEDSEGVFTWMVLIQAKAYDLEPRSSPASVRGAKATRGRRGGRRSALLQEEATPKARSTSKTAEASGDGGEQEEEDEEDDNEDTGGNESEAATLRSRVTSKPGRGRGRPRAGGGSVRRRR